VGSISTGFGMGELHAEKSKTVTSEKRKEKFKQSPFVSCIIA
jgi:hypothetical protein